MNDELDALLQDDWLRPPADFTQGVMQRIEPLPASWSATAAKSAPQRWHRLRWLATATGLVGGGLLGLSQLASFVFGLWLASTAV